MALAMFGIPTRGQWNEAERVAFLRAVRSFEKLPEAALRQAAAAAQLYRAGRGEFIYLAGETVDGMSILAEGQVKIIRETDAGQEVILRLVVPGDVFGMLGSWNARYHHNSSVAQSDATLLRIPRAELLALLDRYPSFSLCLLHEFGSCLRDAESRISDLQTRQAAARVAASLIRAVHKLGAELTSGPDVTVHLSRQDLAELSGTNLCTASRILSSWDHRGIVAAGREQIRIRRPEVLAAIADGSAEVGSDL